MTQIVACLVSSIAAAVFLMQGTGFSILELLLVATLPWALCSWYIASRTVFDIYGMFFVSLFLFNAGQVLLDIFGLNAAGILNGRFDDALIGTTVSLVLLGCNFTHLGALIAIRSSRERIAINGTLAECATLRATGWFLLSIAVIPAITILWDTTRIVMAGGYMAAYQRDFSTGIAAGPQVIATFLVPAALLLLAGANGRRLEKAAAIVIVGMFTINQLFLGYRITAVMPLCAFVWLWNECERKIRARWLVVAGLLMLGVLFPMIRATRDLSGPDRTSFGAFIEGYASLDNPFVASVSEIGGTMATVAYTYALVPASKPFEDGLGYLYALTTVLPNLFWTIHPAIAYGTASDWLIQTVDPVGAAHQVGLGYSCIAETYLNFGWFGVTVAMTLIGFALAKLKTLAVHGTRRHVALVAVFTAFVLRFPRDESGSLVRAFVWYSWLPFAAVTVFAAIANRRAATKGMASRVPLTAEAAARIPTRTANVNVVDHAPGI